MWLDSGQWKVREHDVPYILAWPIKTFYLRLSMCFPFSLAWCRRAWRPWKPCVEDSRAPRWKEAGSLNCCLTESCPLMRAPILDFTRVRNNLGLIFSTSVCLFVYLFPTNKWKDGRRWGKGGKGGPLPLLSTLGGSHSSSPPASLRCLPHEDSVKGGHLFSLDTIQEASVSLNACPSFIRSPQIH